MNIPAKFGIITIATEVAVDGGQVAQALVSADTRHKPLFGKQGKVVNLGNLYFDIVSDFVLRISYFSYRDTFHEIRSTNSYVRNYKKNMQNKANFQKSQMNVSDLLTINYEQMDTWSGGKNKPNSKPIQSQYKPNSKPIQTQFKANSKPIYRGVASGEAGSNPILQSCLSQKTNFSGTLTQQPDKTDLLCLHLSYIFDTAKMAQYKDNPEFKKGP